MKKSFKEKVVAHFLKIAKKNKVMKIPVLFLMTLVLSVYYLMIHFAGNRKRYAVIGFCFVFFFLSSSFAYPVLPETGGFVTTAQHDGEMQAISGDVETQKAAAEQSGAELAKTPQITESMDLPEDDVLLGEYVESQHAAVDDEQLTLEDIINTGGSYTEGIDTAEQHKSKRNLVFSEDDWRLMLVNKQHPIPDDYEFELMTIKGSMQCDARIIDELLLMMQAAKKEGVSLVIRSPYRDIGRQEYLFDKKINMYMKKGMSYMEAYKTSSQAVTVPGASEHQVGLAIDITSEGYASLDAGFGETQAGKWLAEHSSEHGFILRYPEGKEYITSIEYEPWHFRYVGKDAATIMNKESLCLEEFWDKYL